MLPSSLFFMDSKKATSIILAVIFISGALGYLVYTHDRAKQATNLEPVIEKQAHEIATPLANIANFNAIKEKYGLHLTPAQENYFEKNRFLLVEEDATNFKDANTYNFDQMLTNYDTLGGLAGEQNRKPEDAVLVTPDIVLHAYHKYIELTLEELEHTELSDTLAVFLRDLRDNLSRAYKNSTGPTRQRYMNLEAQVALAQVLLDNKSPKKPDSFSDPEQEEAYTKADATIDTAAHAKTILKKYSTDLAPGFVNAISFELDKIYAADQVGTSALFGQYDENATTDYTQFTPRSHYTTNSTLRAYFRTMMYLGRSSYGFKKDVGLEDATLLTEQFSVKATSGTTPLESWERIMHVTGLYAGQSDDITYKEMHDFIAKTLGDKGITPQGIASGELAKTLAEHIGQLRKPKILSDIVVDQNISTKDKAELLKESLSFRVFGQRFSFDAWILNDLTAGQEKTSTKLPSMPSALFVPAAMGDDRAKEYVGTFLQKEGGFSSDEVKGFMGQLGNKRSEIAKVTSREWFSSLGSAWLYVLGSLKGSYGQEYPLYMQAKAFPDKQIQTFLGSFAEIKHDTLLYAKQSYAELGGGGAEGQFPPVVKGYVEPNLEFWHRFQALLAHTQEVFEDNGMFKDHSAMERLKEFKTTCALFTDIATKELQGEPISEDTYEMLRTKRLGFMAAPFDPIDADENASKVALIADIHTDSVSRKILYEATGKPYLMLVAVGNENTPRVAAGLVYNHYELTDGIEKRLSDQDWRTWIYDEQSKIPPKNFWYDSLFAQ